MDLNTYYINQAGSGLPGFEGVRYQRGHGFFGRVFKTALMPLLKFLGKRAVASGADIVGDVLEGRNIKESAKERGKEAIRGVASAGVERARRFVQTGQGRKKKSRRKTSKKLLVTRVKKLKRRKRNRRHKRKRRSEFPDIF
jgi:hypothetical protein